MSLFKCKIIHIFTKLIFLSAAILLPHQALAVTECDCTSDAASPPFLSAGAPPNLLLFIDNSASMLDMGYIDATKESWECFDDTFDNTQSYTGYFDDAQWYRYDNSVYADDVAAGITSNAGRFVPFSGALPGAAANAGGTLYTSADMVAEMWENPANVWNIDLYATGKLLNWATASKLDTQKKILTGGKYDETREVWTSEARGCAGYRFVKEVSLLSGATNYKLTMGIVQGDGFTTLIEIFKISEDGYDNYGDCATAVEEVLFGTGNPQNAVGNCIDPDNDAGNPDKQVLIHSTTDCWKYWKGDLNNWPQHAETLIGKCEDVYNSGVDPREILPSDPAYACFGVYNADPALATDYVGRCWSVGTVCPTVACVDDNDAAVPARGGNDPYYRCDTNIVQYCPKTDYKKGVCEVAWRPYYAPGTCPDDAGAGWVGGYTGVGVIPAVLETCIEDAMTAYCQDTETPQVVDPSDLVVNPADSSTSVGDVYNLPAILVDAGVEGKLGEPIAKMNGLIQKDALASAPEGLLQKYADQIRIGAMAFNNDGSDSECDPASFDPYVTYACDDANNEDGTYLVQEMGGATADLIDGINDIQANTWTPLAEGMFNAIGYFTQDSNYLIKADHLQINGIAAPEPIDAYCQSNNVVIITDGGSTADLNAKMTAVAKGAGKDTDSADASAGCGALYGSSYLDDLTYFAKEDTDLYDNSSYVFTQSPENISTYIVSNGTPRNIGTGECSPATLLTNAADNGSDKSLLTASNPDELYTELDELFQNVLERAASGSAASVIAATRSGEGAVYQAIFWPNMDDPNGDPTVTWVGEVHALMVDSLGQLYEDTVQDSTLNTAEDKRVVFYYNDTEKRTQACYDGTVDIVAGTCSGTSKELNEVNYLWSTAEWLADITNTDILVNRIGYMSNEKRRYIFTWNDLNNDGKVGTPGSLSTQYGFEFEDGTNWNTLSSIATASGRDSLYSDFGVTTAAELNKIVNWMRGKDDVADSSVRDRQVPTPANFDITGNPATITWRLGDVIHSTPTAVGKPVESFHLLYKDATYATFYSQYEHRRNVIYFGANDGMLHAVNGGFYDASSKSFCKNLDSDNLCFDDASMPELGAELWAYVPYNLQPHLKCLMNPDYRHKYFVDLKPRIFDVKIFSADADHPGGWGTILVAGMRLGGKEIESDGLTDQRKFISSYIILDITNPEKKPVLLGELTVNSNTLADIGYTTNIPTVVPMKPNGSDNSEWYLVFGSGPTQLDGTSDQKPRLAVFNLNQLTSALSDPFQIPITLGSTRGSLELSGSGNGFISDPVTMDFLEGGYLDEDYKGDAIYFGTVEGTWGSWSGKMYRWVTNADTLPTTPDDWGDAITNEPDLLINTGRPVSAAPTLGWDGTNYWVYFGTGRFLHEDDKSDASSNGKDLFFGLKEPVDLDGNFTWATIGFNESTGDINMTNTPGSRNLVRTDQIVVSQADEKAQSFLTCQDGSSDCIITSTTSGGLDNLVNNFSELELFIAGTGFEYDATQNPIGYTGTDGWYLKFPEDRERNLGQPTLLGGLTTFTTYQPYEDICLLEGLAYLYGLYFKTGTAWHEPVFNPGSSNDPDPKVISIKEIGRGLATTPNLHVGEAEGAKAIVQTSTGAIVEIEQPTLPLRAIKSGKASWLRE